MIESIKLDIAHLGSMDFLEAQEVGYVPYHIENWIRRNNTRKEATVRLFAVYGENKVSLPQLRYYWGVVLEDIANYTGIYPDELHDAHKAKFGLKTTYILEGESREMIKGLSKMGRKRATEFVNRVIDYWTERGATIREPNQLTAGEILEALQSEQID